MKVIRAAIIDDQEVNLRVLQTILENTNTGVKVVWTADNLEDAYNNLQNKQKKVDLVFLDIEMPPHSSFQLLERLPDPDFAIIFVTAHQEYALKALKNNALDYIVKPVRVEDIVQVIEKFRKTKREEYGELTNIVKEHLNGKKDNVSKIIVNVADGYNVVDIDNIVLIEALDSYTKLILDDNSTYVTSRSLKDFDELLSHKGFYRIHKSYLINFRHISKIVKGAPSSVIMRNGITVPVSARKREQFFNDLKGIISF